MIVNGANLDDLGDYRPGMTAAAEHPVRSPLIECGFDKEAVRTMAAEWGLPIWDKPAAPCLSSRIAYGEEVTPERLAMIDEAEQFLRRAGLGQVRVRYHVATWLESKCRRPTAAACASRARSELSAELRRLGFKYVTLDLEGFRSGSLNQLLTIS